MKVLIIADNLGNNAPGVVFKNVLSGLSSKCEFDLITSTPDYSSRNEGNFYYVEQKRIGSWTLRTLLFKIFGFYHTQYWWAKRIQKLIKKNYDVIISFMSSTFYSSVTAADIYARKHHVKHICYCVDAVPAPFPWETDQWYSNAMKRLVKKRLKHVDILCMTNNEMLEYETNVIGFKPSIIQVIPNSPKYSELIELNNEISNPAFAYAGKLYGLRQSDALIDGFHLFRENYPTAELYFIGTGQLEEELRNKRKNLNNIIFIDYTDNLEDIYNKCIALIDINANIDNDVFLSSKIVSYLPFNRLIISESGKNSPSRNLFKKTETIIHVSHDKFEYCNAMNFCVENYFRVNYSERNSFLENMSISSAADILLNFIDK